jgi:hypothetical protein
LIHALIVIYSYEAPKAQVVRRFQNLGVQRANPSEYVARYGAQLEDAQSLITHARQAGVVEDIVNLFREISTHSYGMISLFSHLLLMQHQLFNHPIMKVINQVVPVVVVVVSLVMILLHPQLVVFLRLEAPVLI